MQKLKWKKGMVVMVADKGNGTTFEAVFEVDANKSWYMCSDNPEWAGANTANRHGKKFSWGLGTSKEVLAELESYDLELIGEATTPQTATVDIDDSVSDTSTPDVAQIPHPRPVARRQKAKKKPKIIFSDDLGGESMTEGLTQEPPEKPFTIIGTFNINHIKVLEASIKENTPALLVGHTGLGKTTLVAELARKHNKKLVRLSVHSGVTADEILGKWLAESGSTIWQDGLLVQAMKNGHWIVFDEINACPADVLMALHALLDDDRHVTLLEKKGEVVRPHADFRFFATMNPQDDYAGTKDMNMAFTSRFNAVLEIEPYPQDVEVEILMSKGIKKQTATDLVTTATKLREFKKNDEIMYFCGTRDIINTAKLTDSGLTLKEAIQYGIANKMSKDDKEFCAGKIPDFKFKTKEQIELERAKKEFTDYKAQIDPIMKKKDADYKALYENYQKQSDALKKAGDGGNTNLDASTIKALKILKVLK